MQNNKLKDSLTTMSPHKIYDIEVLEGDMVYIGKEVFAKDEQQAFEMMILMFGGLKRAPSPNAGGANAFAMGIVMHMTRYKMKVFIILLL